MMRTALVVGAILLLVLFAAAASPNDGPKTAIPGSEPVTDRQGGEDLAGAVPILSLPFHDVGTTCGYLDDYDEVCPYGPHASPDVVYSYIPAVHQLLCISLCNSYYDTELFVYEDAWTPGDPFACNDDECSGPNYPAPYLSELWPLVVFAGHTYYIVVDGYAGSCGTYVLDIATNGVCTVDCPPSGRPEGEPPCHDGYVDLYNGGCDSAPPVFQAVECDGDPAIYCGKSGSWTVGEDEHIDSDWYEIALSETKTITASVEAEFHVFLSLMDGNATPGPDPCLDPDLLIAEELGSYCQEISITRILEPGTYWIQVRPYTFPGPVSCEIFNCYTLTIQGYCGETGAEDGSWGRVKRRFR
ncbi:MAG: hypothetical protein ABIH26_13960 [Candidatus Eisenbacteria bacterium]